MNLYFLKEYLNKIHLSRQKNNPIFFVKKINKNY